MGKASLKALYRFRRQKIILLEEKRISEEEFANATFGVMVKFHFKAKGKPKNITDLLSNYLYWTTYIERKIVQEQKLIELGLGSEAQLFQAMDLYIKRRDKTICRLLSEFKEEPEQMYLISSKIVEISFKEDFIVHVSKEALESIGIFTQNRGVSAFPAYVDKFILKG